MLRYRGSPEPPGNWKETTVGVLGGSPWDTDPRVAPIVAEYELFYATPEGKRLDAAAASREAFAALPEELKDKAWDLSRRLNMARMEVRREQKGS